MNTGTSDGIAAAIWSRRSAWTTTALAPESRRMVGVVPGTGIEWQGDWISAQMEAKDRNVPIMFVLHKENVPACEKMAKTSFMNKQVIKKPNDLEKKTDMKMMPFG